MGDNNKEWTTPTISDILTKPPEEPKIDVSTWAGKTSIKANKRGIDGKEELKAPEAISKDKLTPDEDVMTLNPNSVIATKEFKAYRERKVRGK